MNGQKLAVCGFCNSTNVFGVSRVVGYYSKINNWNKSKLAEFSSRQKGNYKLHDIQKDLSRFTSLEAKKTKVAEQ
ncbi:MAG: hypothetical protein KAJ54_01605 [Candidatus Aenigmarchaeota archaeon]|nr:hypothetical protein [Candidatus Aenigmarchaeota archaeon]MCK5322269.1 hypothetical protein [Candidatus Aenigmarchaeota archaeon]